VGQEKRGREPETYFLALVAHSSRARYTAYIALIGMARTYVGGEREGGDGWWEG